MTIHRLRIGWGVIVSALWLWGGPALALLDAPDVDLLRQQNSLKAEMESKVQQDILDPILGKDRSKVFTNIELEYTTKREDKTEDRAGSRELYSAKPGNKVAVAGTEYILPGVPKPKYINNPNAPVEKPSDSRSRVGALELQKKEQVFALDTNVKSILFTIIHDDTILQPKLDTVRDRIIDAFPQYKVNKDQIVFRSARFDTHPWTDDLRNPNVYLPLLYAALLLLFLLFLFGPLARFMRRYVDAIKEKPAAEVNVESTIEPPEEEGGGGGPDESKLDIMLGRKPPEPSPAEDEEDAMKKFEPFSYINEENLKRLAYLFLLRREEPWLIAVVLSYLKPEYARQVLTALPVDLQAKVALEALMVRQVTREQVMAIDAQVKENVEFVVGGIARLTQMLEESDTPTRDNILEYLKNEKPSVYDKVRKLILTFEDIVHFPDRDMQTIVRELKPESMAKALQNTSPEVLNKFFNNMSTGASSLLRESMEYSKGLTHAQVEDERSKIMDIIKAMEKEGKIVVREAMRDRGADSFQEELAIEREDRYSGARKADKASTQQDGSAAENAGAGPAPGQAPDPAIAQQYFQAGLQSMQAGAMDDCVQQLRQAVDLDPNLWQAYQYLGGVLYQMGRAPEAMVCYEKVLEFNPDPQLKAWIESYKAQVQ